MIKRTLYFGNSVYLRLKNKQLEVHEPELKEKIASIPIEDIGIVIIDNPRITITSGVLQAFNDNNTAFVTCNSSHMPESITIPLDGHSTQTERLRYQLNASEPLKKQLWQQTTIAKIKNQARVLDIIGKDSKRLHHLATIVKAGDAENVEGRAAAYYWKTLFNEDDFTRDRYGYAPNAHLNYIYSIVRSILGRALVSSGLLPILGVHHKNKYNSYCLADDIMEPFRPVADLVVYRMWENKEIIDDEISKEQKVKLLSIVTEDVLIDKQKSPLMISASRTTNTLFECFQGNRRKIVYPEVYEP